MPEIKLLGLSCNWGPYACYNAAARWGNPMPPNFRLIRVMCIGRINQALILQAFEHGADGVILLRCHDEDCRYGPGPEMGLTNTERVRRLLRLLGIGQQRLIERAFAPHERNELAEALWDFHRRIVEMGPNPAKPRQEREAS